MNWNYIVIEGYCLRKLSKKLGKYVYVWEGDFNKMKKELNPHYDPHYKIPKRPKFCKKRVCYTCLKKDCKYFGYCSI